MYNVGRGPIVSRPYPRELDVSIVRIWHQGFVELDSVPQYAASLAEHAAAVAAAGTVVDLHGLASGTYTPWGTAADLARDPARMEFGRRQVVENILRAEREGYDAAAITIVQNVGMREARATVRIPVASYGEAAMREAAARGERFGVVAFDDAIAEIVSDEVEALGYAAHAVPVEIVEADYGGVVEAFTRPERLAGAFTVAARRAIARGARVIIPGQTIMAEALWRNGVREIDGVPVIDALAVTIADAERMVRVRATSPRP